jgi:hypothetical protein
MSSHDNSRHVEVRDGDYIGAAAEVSMVRHAEGTVRTSLLPSSGHTRPGSIRLVIAAR